jgi:hypothetical protein
MLRQELTVKVSVGIGSTSPEVRVRQLTGALKEVKEILEDDVITKNGGDVKAIVEEIFTRLGFDGAEQFFPGKTEDPQVAELQKQLDEAMAKLAKREDPELTAAKVAKLAAETGQIDAKKTQTNVQSMFGAMQAAEVIAAVPEVAPLADQLMKASGYQDPVPEGIDPGFAPGEQGPNSNVIGQAAPGLTVEPIVNKKTGIGFTPGGAQPGDGGDRTPGIPTSTNPMTPALPASALTGPNKGIETMRPDTQGAER